MLRLKELRELTGLNMKDMARNIGLPYTTYISYEKGLREPDSETLIKIANYFNVSIDYLVGRESASKEEISKRVERQLAAAFWGDSNDWSEEDIAEMWEDVRAFAEFREEQQRRKKKE